MSQTRYELVRDLPCADDHGKYIVIQRHPEQPADGFATAMEAEKWCYTPPHELGWQWYVKPVEDK